METQQTLAGQIRRAFAGGRPVTAVMLFFNEKELGISQNRDAWINTRNIFFTDPWQALDTYASIRCPASQLISEAKSHSELEAKMNKILSNFRNPNWLRNKHYPCL